MPPPNGGYQFRPGAFAQLGLLLGQMGAQRNAQAGLAGLHRRSQGMMRRADAERRRREIEQGVDPAFAGLGTQAREAAQGGPPTLREQQQAEQLRREDVALEREDRARTEREGVREERRSERSEGRRERRGRAKEAGLRADEDRTMDLIARVDAEGRRADEFDRQLKAREAKETRALSKDQEIKKGRLETQLRGFDEALDQARKETRPDPQHIRSLEIAREQVALGVKNLERTPEGPRKYLSDEEMSGKLIQHPELGTGQYLRDKNGAFKWSRVKTAADERREREETNDAKAFDAARLSARTQDGWTELSPEKQDERILDHWEQRARVMETLRNRRQERDSGGDQGGEDQPPGGAATDLPAAARQANFNTAARGKAKEAKARGQQAAQALAQDLATQGETLLVQLKEARTPAEREEVMQQLALVQGQLGLVVR